jgi:hypothetical protein
MINNPLKETQTAIALLFELEGIKQVVCVDDQYREYPDDMINDIIGELKADSSLRQQVSEEIDEFNDIQWEEEDIWKKQLGEKWDDASSEVRKDYYYRINEVIPLPEAKDIKYSAKLKEILEQVEGVELKEVSFADWKAACEKYLEGENARRTLFLFDQNLTKEGGRETEGIDIISRLSKDYEEIRCGLLSQTFSPDDEYHEWREFAEENKINKDHFTLISKARLTDDPLGFARMLSLTLMNRRCGKVKKIVSKIIEETVDESSNELDELHIYNFEDIVFRSSYEEGIWEPDTLFRLYSIFQKEKVRRRALKDDDLRGCTDSIRKLININVRKTKTNSGESWKIQRRELYENGKHINVLHMPIELGDIFLKTGTSKKFILLGQPCNLMVRTNNAHMGKRTNDYHEVVLAQIVDEEKKGETEDSYYELLYFNGNEGNKWYADFRKTHTVLLCVLDLCVFNDDGHAKISINGNCPDIAIPSWKKRFEILHKKAKNTINRYKEYNKGNKLKDKDILQLVVPKSSHYKNGLFKAEIDCSKAGGEILYGCQRVGRLCQPRAGEMLTKYAHYISRMAFEHDFAKFKKDE